MGGGTGAGGTDGEGGVAVVHADRDDGDAWFGVGAPFDLGQKRGGEAWGTISLY